MKMGAVQTATGMLRATLILVLPSCLDEHHVGDPQFTIDAGKDAPAPCGSSCIVAMPESGLATDATDIHHVDDGFTYDASSDSADGGWPTISAGVRITIVAGDDHAV